MRNNFFPLRVTKPWNRFPREGHLPGEYLWRYSRPAWTRSCVAWSGWPCFGRRVELDDPQRSLPTPKILGFCDCLTWILRRVELFPSFLVLSPKTDLLWLLVICCNMNTGPTFTDFFCVHVYIYIYTPKAVTKGNHKHFISLTDHLFGFFFVWSHCSLWCLSFFFYSHPDIYILSGINANFQVIFM